MYPIAQVTICRHSTLGRYWLIIGQRYWLIVKKVTRVVRVASIGKQLAKYIKKISAGNNMPTSYDVYQLIADEKRTYQISYFDYQAAMSYFDFQTMINVHMSYIAVRLPANVVFRLSGGKNEYWLNIAVRLPV